MVEPELTGPEPPDWGWDMPPDGGPTASGSRWRRIAVALVAIVAAAALVVHLLPVPVTPGPDRTFAASNGTVTFVAGDARHRSTPPITATSAAPSSSASCSRR